MNSINECVCCQEIDKMVETCQSIVSDGDSDCPLVLHNASLNTQDFSLFVLISMSSAQHGHSINSNIEMPIRGQSTNSSATLPIDSLQDGAGEFWVKRCESSFHPVQLCAYEHTSLPLDLKKTLNLKDFIMLMNDFC